MKLHGRAKALRENDSLIEVHEKYPAFSYVLPLRGLVNRGSNLVSRSPVSYLLQSQMFGLNADFTPPNVPRTLESAVWWHFLQVPPVFG